MLWKRMQIYAYSIRKGIICIFQQFINFSILYVTNQLYGDMSFLFTLLTCLVLNLKYLYI